MALNLIGNKLEKKVYSRRALAGRVQSNVISAGESIGEITGYIAIWNQPGTVDAYGTWFDRSKPPDMALDFLPIPLCYEHGFDGSVQKEIIGAVTNFFFDDTGIGFRGYLNRASRFYEPVLESILEKRLKTSSATAGHIADFDEQNRFVRWYLAELSLTENPAEYNMPIVTLVRSRGCDGGRCIISYDFPHNPQELPGVTGVNAENVTPNQPIRSNVMTALQQLLQANPNPSLEELLAALMQDGFSPEDIQAYVEQMAGTGAATQPPDMMLSDGESDDLDIGEQFTTHDLADFFLQLQAQGQGGQDEDESEPVNTPAPVGAGAQPAAAPARNKGKAKKGGQQRQGQQQPAQRGLATRGQLTNAQRRQSSPNGLTPQPPANRPNGNGYRTVSNASNQRSAGGQSIRVSSQFDRLSAADMALGAVMMQSAFQRGATQNPLSDEYYRAMAYKTALLMDAGDKIANDFAVVRSFPAEGRAMRRANEINSIDISYIRAGEVMNGTATQGAEWIDELQGTTLWEFIRQETPVYDAFLSKGMDEQELPQGFNQENIPLEGTDPSWYVAAGAANVDANSGNATPTFSPSKFSTGEAVVTVAKLSTALFFQRELEEDSIINIVQEANRKIRISASEQIEYILINGDTATAINTNINLRDGTPAVAPVKPSYTLLNGLLKLALITNAANSRDCGVAFDDVDFLQTLALLPGKYRNARDKLMWILDSDTALAAANIPVFKTRDVYSKATLEEGNLMSIIKIDVMESGQMGLANTSGFISGTPSNNTTGRVVLARPDQWASRWKRRIQTDVFYDSYSDVTRITAHMRWGIAYRDNEASAVMYNIPVTLS